MAGGVVLWCLSPLFFLPLDFSEGVAAQMPKDLDSSHRATHRQANSTPCGDQLTADENHTSYLHFQHCSIAIQSQEKWGTQQKAPRTKMGIQRAH